MADTANSTVKFHISLNVSDLNRSISFYRTLFGAEPAKHRPDYAKFEPAEPPLVLSLEPSPRNPGGSLNHVGLRVRNAAELVGIQSRLEASGISTDREEGVECCYSKQTKFWVSDPDRVLWEIYVLEEDIDHCGSGQTLAQIQTAYKHLEPQPATVSSEPAVLPWEHRLGDAIPNRIDLSDGGVKEVRLSGSVNDGVAVEDLNRLLAESYRILEPGGAIVVHGLVADRIFPNGYPKLPGPAAVVKRVPLETEVFDWVREGGFADIQIIKRSPSPCFVRDGVEMRELRLSARKP